MNKDKEIDTPANPPAGATEGAATPPECDPRAAAERLTSFEAEMNAFIFGAWARQGRTSNLPTTAPTKSLHLWRDAKAESTRLREALERVADLSERWEDSLVSQINKIAREALTGGQ